MGDKKYFWRLYMKMNVLKKAGLAAFAAVVVMLAVSCAGLTADNISGTTWVGELQQENNITLKITMEFTDDTTGKQTVEMFVNGVKNEEYSNSTPFTYTYASSSGTITIGDTTTPFTVNVSAKTLTATSDETTMVLKLKE
jgi:hypothetical protein